jgi:hypothetical protein
MLEIVTAMEHVVADYRQFRAQLRGPGPEVAKPVEKPGDFLKDIPRESPVEKAKPGRTEKQRENDERLRAAAKAKAAAKKAAKAQPLDTASMMPKPPPPKTAEGMDPAEVVKIRQKTIEELQAAYANGFQKEVFELLSRFGNGAKSFRELPPDAFVPIREAIDNGALT